MTSCIQRFKCATSLAYCLCQGRSISGSSKSVSMTFKSLSQNVSKYSDIYMPPRIQGIKKKLFYSNNYKQIFTRGNVNTSLNNCTLWSSFHTSAYRNALPPVLVFLLRPLAKLTVIIFGRSLRVWWRSSPQSEKEFLKNKLIQHKFLFLGILSPLTAGGCYFYVSHIEEEPITKRKRFIAFSKEQMVELAQYEESAIREENKASILPSNHPVYKRVVRVANRLLQANIDLPGVQERNWTITVVDNPDIKNALVLPNGSIYVFSGILELCSNDDQLGVVLAHEISHAVLCHMAEQLSSVYLVEFLLLLPILIIWAVLPDVGAAIMQWLSSHLARMLIHLPFSRNTEIEADNVGLQLAAKACFDVRESSAFWGKLRILMSNDNQDNVEWLSTHPSYETRQQFLDSIIPSAIQARETYSCPKLPPVDPRSVVVTLLKSIESEQENCTATCSASQSSP